MVFVVMEATGFLRYMVRNIVGTLLLVGQEKIDKSGVPGDSRVEAAGESRSHRASPRSSSKGNKVLSESLSAANGSFCLS